MAKKETKKETKKTKEATAVAVKKADANVPAELMQVANNFFNVDFSAMNSTIDSLANRGKLSTIEKHEANKIIDTWNDNVVNKLKLEERNIRDFLSRISGSMNSGIPSCIDNQQFIDEIEMLVEYAGLQDKYDEMCATVDEYNTALAIKNNIPSIDDDIDTTEGELIYMRRDYEYEVTVAQKNLQKVGNKLARQNAAIVAALNADPNVRKIIAQLKKRAANMAKMSTMCCDKAQLAKINITIDDDNVRNTLKELVELTKF